jgi:hypothetical protein
MGYMTELNTLLGLSGEFDESKLSVGSKHIVVKGRERAFPLHIAMLLVNSKWEFLGYVVAHTMKNFEDKCEIEFEVLSLFSENEQTLYKEKFVEAAKKTGEIK